MAGVYIKGVETPINCYGCRFGRWPADGSRPYCIVTDEDATELDYFSKRMAHCPLIAVPDHGRLGDLDALEKGLRLCAKYQSGDRQQGMLGCCETIRLAPTIIPADKEEQT